MKIVKNWLDQDFINYLNHTFLHEYPHFYKEGSTKKSVGKGDMFYSFDFSTGSNTAIEYLKHKLIKSFFASKENKGEKNVWRGNNLVQPIFFDRIYFNVQHPGMDGTFHRDYEKGKTALLMITPEDKGGAFVYKDKNRVKEISYEQNKLIVFDGSIPHYGKSFFKKPRITLTFKKIKLRLGKKQ